MPKLRRRRIIRRILIFFTVAISLALLAAVGLGFYLYDHHAPHREIAEQLVAEGWKEENLGPQVVALDDIPPLLIEAFILVQEPSFRSYQGHPNYKGIIGAARKKGNRPHAIGLGLAHWLEDGKSSDFVQHSQAFIRQLIAFEIEKKFEKHEILYFALNARRFSKTSRGPVNGARAQFNKPLNDLSDDELITLALISLNPDYRKPPLPQRMVDETREQL